jgi:hypothetical protein
MEEKDEKFVADKIKPTVNPHSETMAIEDKEAG